MKNINDTKIYLSIIITPIIVALLVGGASLYSRLHIEPKAKALISSAATMKDGYLLLREPQVFGGYKYWDSDGMAVKNSLRYFDNKIYNNMDIRPDERIYLDLVLKRRESGSLLGLKTALYLLIVSLTGSVAYIFERKQLKVSEQ